MKNNSGDQIGNFWESEIDLRIFFKRLIRQRNAIAKFIILGIIFSGFNAFTSKKIWQGDFQIVIENDSQTSNITDSFNLRGLNNSQLTTEVQILKSPSVLLETFEIIKNKTNNENLNFSDWRSQFKFNLKPRTSILEITYKHPDKKLIKETLTMISSTYQKYSGSKRDRDIELSLNFINSQLPIYKLKASESTKKAQEFAIKYDLISPYIVQSDGQFNSSAEINTEARRIIAANEIRTLEEKINKLNNDELTSEEIIYLATTTFPEDTLLELYKEVEENLFLSKDNYTNNDETLVKLRDSKKKLIKQIREKILVYFVSKKKESQLIAKVSERPQEVLTNHTQLVWQSKQDQLAYKDLEKQYRSILLEKSRYKDPWKLITKPTILPNPVAPDKSLILILGAIWGFLFGLIYAIIKEKIDNVIFSEIQISNLSSLKLIYCINDEYENYDGIVNVFLNNNIIDTNLQINFIKVGEFENIRINKFVKFLKKEINSKNIEVYENIDKVSNKSNSFLLLQLGSTRIDLLKKIERKIQLQNRNIVGIFYFNKT